MSQAKLQQTVLGDVLKKWRESSGWNMREAADLMGISAPTLCRIENGESSPDAHTLLALLNWMLRTPDA